MLSTFIAIVFFILLILSAYLHFKQNRDHMKLRERFKSVIDLEEETRKAEKAHSRVLDRHENELNTLKRATEDVRIQYSEKRQLLDKLMAEIKLMDETVDIMSYGIYEPSFDFDTSERYKQRLQVIREKQKSLIRDKKAAICSTEWQVSGSKAEGRKMINRQIRLMLRAFNGECDAAITKVKWNNVQTMEQRIERAYQAINKLGETNQVYITDPYYLLKLDELHCAYEYEEKREQEKQEQRRIREEMREEARVQKELEKAQEEAEKEEHRYEVALAKARKDVEAAEGEKRKKLSDQIAQLEAQLAEAQEKRERAISQAQLTRSGHVYIISNIGSFGEDMYKIGMTRRLEPMDRVKELGDASVPFGYDIHGMIYSEDAPGLEARLHQQFNDKRVNLVNTRKEFFFITLGEIEKAVHSENEELELTKLAEAREYRESQAIRNRAAEQKEEERKKADAFPVTI